MELKFKAKVYRIGTSFALTVPKAYIDNGQLDRGQTYQVLVNTEPVEPNGNGSGKAEPKKVP